MFRSAFLSFVALALSGTACGSSDSTPDISVLDASLSDAAVVDAAVVDAMPLAPDAVIGSEFVASHCEMVAKGLNIHWEAVSGSSAPCTGVETTDGDPLDAMDDGMVTVSGVSVSNENCIGTSIYEFTLSQDGLSLSGRDTLADIPMTLTRLSSQACFVGHWVMGPDDFVAHISAAAFGL